MGLIDSILNLTGVLLWLNWRSVGLSTLQRASPVSLAATVRKADPRRSERWFSLVALVVVLIARGFFYWNVGPALSWTPSLELGVVSLPFRCDYVNRMLLFSALSFGIVLCGVYAWLLLLSVVNRRVPNDEPVQRLVRLHLGWLERWPTWAKLLLPLVFTALAWALGSPGLVQLGILPVPLSRSHLWEQALVLGITSFLSWKFLVLGLCLLYLVNSYVYLGHSLLWKYVNLTGANLLWPLRRLPIRVGKVDLAPVLAIILVVAVTHWASRLLLGLFQGLPL